MFCYQCQETAKGTGCTVSGVCGKKGDVAALQDLLIHITKEISKIAVALREKSIELPDLDRFVVDSLFMTVTNTNFDVDRFTSQIRKAYDVRDRAYSRLLGKDKNSQFNSECGTLTWRSDDVVEMIVKGGTVGVMFTTNDDIRSLRELLIYGVKGIAAYAKHAANLGFEDRTIYAFIQEALAATLCPDKDADDLTNMIVGCGENGVKVMALLDEANTRTYGHPEMTKVNLGVRKNPGILISGHDLKDLHELLEQTKDSGVDVYTHGEMLPANSYPAFKKYSNFVGNYGGSWWQQHSDFEKFNGVILITTNCIVPPTKDAKYMDRVFTTGVAGCAGFAHIPDRTDDKPKDFSPLIARALTCNSPTEIEKGEIMGGFAHNQLFALTDKILENVKKGSIRKFVVMAGCDGRNKSREYYTEFAEKLPKDCVILTAGCAKYRYNKLKLGEINGIPRVIDAGQCNDSYSLAIFAIKLKEILGVKDINELPIIYNIAWYEQKAVLVLLSLLVLGVKNIRLGPTLPAYLPKILIEKFGIKEISTAEKDLKEIK